MPCGVRCTWQRLESGRRTDGPRHVLRYSDELRLTLGDQSLATGGHFTTPMSGGPITGRTLSVCEEDVKMSRYVVNSALAPSGVLPDVLKKRRQGHQDNADHDSDADPEHPTPHRSAHRSALVVAQAGSHQPPRGDGSRDPPGAELTPSPVSAEPRTQPRTRYGGARAMRGAG